MQEWSGILYLRNTFGIGLRKRLLTFSTLWKKVQNPFSMVNELLRSSETDKPEKEIKKDQLIAKITEIFVDRLQDYSPELGGERITSKIKKVLENMYESGQDYEINTSLDFRRFGSKYFSGLELTDNQVDLPEFTVSVNSDRSVLTYSSANDEKNVFLTPDKAVFGEFVSAVVIVPSRIDTLKIADEIDSVWMSSGVVSPKERRVEIALPEIYGDETLLVFTGQRYMDEYGEHLKAYESLRCVQVI